MNRKANYLCHVLFYCDISVLKYECRNTDGFPGFITNDTPLNS